MILGVKFFLALTPDTTFSAVNNHSFTSVPPYACDFLWLGNK
jgi:hypothetical protein